MACTIKKERLCSDKEKNTGSYIFTKIVLYNVLYVVILHIWRHIIYPQLQPKVKNTAPVLWTVAEYQNYKLTNGVSDTKYKFNKFIKIFWTIHFFSIYWRSNTNEIFYEASCKPSLTLPVLGIYQCHLVNKVLTHAYDCQVFHGGIIV